MALPNVVTGGYIDIAVGDGATPEVFTYLCGLTARTFTVQANTNDVFIEDCADPEYIPVRIANVTGRQWDMSGEGLFNRGQAALMRSLIGVSRNYRFIVSEPSTDPIDSGYFEGPAIITNWQISGGASGENVTNSITIISNGEWVWVDA